THVAGILGASANNGLGGAGVVWKVRILACKFLTEDGEGATSDAIECLDYARARGAKVVNCSWGGSANSVALRNAFRRLRDAGIAVAIAAGNDGLDIDAQPQYPASYAYDNMVTVVATTSTDGLADFSNYGLVGTHVGAPGVSIVSTWFSSDRAYSRQSGTSMATPMVSGILALLRAKYPAETAVQAVRRLRTTAEPLASLTGSCATGGRANLFRALKGLPFLRLSTGSAGGWSLEITGTPASSCRIEASEDLAAWEALGEVTLSESGAATYPGPVDSARARFLRLVVLP
ncbi:MAG: S8 family serine peptidase, partial [Verrucomicrobiales bacterium]|nr:S8 family serine peptidase [Verrucomicrobiales bacterium]